MWKLELVCAAIVALYVVVRARRDPEPKRFLSRLFFVAVAGWTGEDSIIHAYDFYGYSREWTVLLDELPLMVLVIWPVVISSAWDLARRLAGDSTKAVLLGAAIVLFDASLIEPAAVRAGLWAWNEPGLFHVPPIGILGWAIFAAFVLHAWRRDWHPLVMIAVATIGTHVALLAAWWGLFRWVNGPVPEVPLIAALWAAGLVAAVLIWRANLRARIPVVEMVLRIPGAIFFFTLLAIADADPTLVAWVFGFAPPYLALTDWRDVPALVAPRS